MGASKSKTDTSSGGAATTGAAESPDAEGDPDVDAILDALQLRGLDAADAEQAKKHSLELVEEEEEPETVTTKDGRTGTVTGKVPHGVWVVFDDTNKRGFVKCSDLQGYVTEAEQRAITALKKPEVGEVVQVVNAVNQRGLHVPAGTLVLMHKPYSFSTIYLKTADNNDKPFSLNGFDSVKRGSDHAEKARWKAEFEAAQKAPQPPPPPGVFDALVVAGLVRFSDEVTLVSEAA